MYAIIQDRGRQYRVETGDRVLVDRVDVEIGAEHRCAVLLIEQDGNVQVGSPELDATCTCKVLRHQRGKKGRVGTYQRRKDSRRRVGFRHDHSVLEIVSIA